ncbi:hypothetical protein SCHPADRAFT_944531 [Schizopora paradoxa]|uniref:Uncharacterized protein n=1 Tax=Schizopora paradoxa TaxID=27342 RepID=A0A0H2RFM5_9AGAM|nr:hypothetical protein SCHPADRAFT_944531 [Schizopora paradoxa]
METYTITPSRQAPCFIEQLPVEVLLHVFALITNEFNPSREEPSIDVGDCNPWANDLRNKKALNRVCRRWHGITTPSLYDRVYLHRIGQLVALVRILEKSNSGEEGVGYGSFVRHIHGRLIVHPDWNAVYVKHIVRLLEICSAARSFSWRTVWTYADSDLELAQGFTSNIISLLSVRSTMNSVRKLTFPLSHPHRQDESHDFEDLSKITFENLEELTCEVFDPLEIDGLATVSSSFVVPKIKKLTICGSWDTGSISKVHDPIFLYGVLQSHGSKLSSLTLDILRIGNDMLSCVSSILDLTPNLQELHLSTHAFTAFNPDLVAAGPYPNLRKLRLMIDEFCISTSDRSPNRDPRLDNYFTMVQKRKIFPSFRTFGLLNYVFSTVPLDGRIPLSSHADGYSYLSTWAEKFKKQGITLVDVDDEVIAPTGPERWTGRFVPSRSLEEDVHSDPDDLSFPSDVEDDYGSSEYSSWDSDPGDDEMDKLQDNEIAYSEVGSTEMLERFENSLESSEDEDQDEVESD